MKINYSDLGESQFGKFVGCAMMSEKQYLDAYDTGNLKLKITLDDYELDPLKVFGMWEQAVGYPDPEQGGPKLGRHENGTITLAPSTLYRMIDMLTGIRYAVIDVESRAISAQHAMGRRGNTLDRDSTSEQVYQHCMGAAEIDLTKYVRDDIEAMRVYIDALIT